MLKGLPGSGKTTHAKELVKQGFKRINNDDLRDMIDGGKFSHKNELIISEIREAMVGIFMEHGCDIVVDNCNFNPIHKIDMCLQAELHNDTNKTKYEVEEKLIDIPLEECIRRDSLRDRKVGEKVIKDMYERYLK